MEVQTKAKSKFLLKNVFGYNAIKPITCTVSFVCFLIILLIENRQDFIGIVFLPLSFFFVSVFFNFSKHITGLAKFIVYMAYMLRFTIFPVLICAGNYYSDIAVNIWQDFFNLACFLMIVELLAVFAMLSRFGIRRGKLLKTYKKQGRLNSIEKVVNTKAFTCLICACMLYVVLVSLVYPKLLTTYWSFIFIRKNELVRLNALENLIGQMHGYMYYPYKLASELLRYLVPIALLVKVNNSKYKFGMKTTYTFVILFVAFSLRSSEQINSVIIVIVGLYYLVLKYYKYDKYIVLCCIILVVVGFFCFMLLIADVNSMNGLARIVNAYFNGPVLIAQSVKLKYDSGAGIFQIFEDFFSAIPVISKASGMVSLTDKFRVFYGVKGSLVSLVGTGYYYFGVVGCWIPAVIITLTANFFDELAEKAYSEKYLLAFSLCGINCSLALFMYEMNVFYSAWVYIYIWILLAYKLDKTYKNNIIRNRCGQKKEHT